MERSVAWEELGFRLTNPNMLRHSLAVEAIMRRLALELDQDEHQWGLAGLLHDIAVERSQDLPLRHAAMGAEILENLEADPTVIHAVRVHHDQDPLLRRRSIDKALYCANAAATLVVSAVLARAEKRLDSVDAEQLTARHADAVRAAGEAGLSADSSWRRLESCTLLDISVERMYLLALEAMRGIGEELGL